MYEYPTQCAFPQNPLYVDPSPATASFRQVEKHLGTDQQALLQELSRTLVPEHGKG